MGMAVRKTNIKLEAKPRNQNQRRSSIDPSNFLAFMYEDVLRSRGISLIITWLLNYNYITDHRLNNNPICLIITNDPTPNKSKMIPNSMCSNGIQDEIVSNKWNCQFGKSSEMNNKYKTPNKKTEWSQMVIYQIRF